MDEHAGKQAVGLSKSRPTPEDFKRRREAPDRAPEDYKKRRAAIDETKNGELIAELRRRGLKVRISR